MSEKPVFKHKEGKGSLFKNNYKEKETHPDLTGTCTDANGETWALAGWKSTTQSGEPYISITIDKPYTKEKDTSSKGTKLDLDLPDF